MNTTRKIATLFTLFAVILIAQQTGIVQSADTIESLVPNGDWPICEADPSYSACHNFTPGHETYILEIHSASLSAVAYRYEIIAESSTGTPTIINGIVPRLDSIYGYSYATVDFGGVVNNWKIVVQNLVPASN